MPSVLDGTYSSFGADFPSMVRTVLGHPILVIRPMLSRPSLSYLAQLLFPLLGVLGFGDPVSLSMLPQLGMILISDAGSRLLQIRIHFSLVPVLLLYIGAIGTMTWAQRLPPLRLPRRLATPRAIAILMLAASVLTVPLWARRALGRLNPHVAEIRQILRTIPNTASVAVPGYLLDELTHRRQLELLWHEEDLTRTEFVILEEPRLMFFEGTSVDLSYLPHGAEVLRDGGYEQVIDRDGWHVWRRAATQPASSRD